MRPWTRWWWLGSAVDAGTITHLLEEYRQAGLGGVEITPIYGIQGEEAHDIPFLSDRWLEMLRHTLSEAARLDMGVDMVTGTGWPFGGPNVSDEDAEDRLVLEKMPSSADHSTYVVSQKWAGRRVKRAAPGGEGKCINPFSRTSLMHYLERFDVALADLPQGTIRCQFHDSFEYLADWAPTVFAEFQARRGYDLKSHLPALAGDADPETVARVKTDYRETMSDMLRENFTKTWTEWTHTRGSRSRNQAHGSPGNLLDLYGTADIPETEIFGGPGDPRANKFASSAAHVLGKPLVSSECCTWLGEHFTVSLAQCKAALDRLLCAGINHVFYHGTAYSPADAAWPGRLFYASTTFAPQDPLWHDFPALNAYIARCQSLLQSGEPDNDVLLYWPLHDLWQTRPDAFMLEINGAWLTDQPIGATAQRLWDGGYAFDYVSDHQLTLAQYSEDGLQMPGGRYQAILVPPCAFMPEETLQTLLHLAGQGATVIFQDHLPGDVPGLFDLPRRRERFQTMLASAEARRFRVGPDVKALLEDGQVRREFVANYSSVRCLRLRHAGGHDYFLVNEGQDSVDGWVTLASPLQSAVLMDAMTGETGTAAVRPAQSGQSEVFLQLPPGASLFVRALGVRDIPGPIWRYVQPAGDAVPLTGTWGVEFLDGGPALPLPFQTDTLGSWTDAGDDDAQRFAGTARYTLTFAEPTTTADEWHLDLGRICESARVHLNGTDLGMLIAPPFRVRLGALKSEGNVLEIEVTNLAANRIRDMDRQRIPWKVFREINFVDIHYQPFDASGWTVHPSGLLGPVRLVPMQQLTPGRANKLDGHRSH